MTIGAYSWTADGFMIVWYLSLDDGQDNGYARARKFPIWGWRP